MANGDTVTVLSGNYAAGSAHSGIRMLWLVGLSGSIRCEADDLSCVLSGSGTRMVMGVIGTSGGVLELRGLVFSDGHDSSGGGLRVADSAQAYVVMCSIQQNQGTYEGGGIFVKDGGTVVDLYGVSFSGNTSPSGPDINQHSGTITIHSACSAGEN